MDAGSWGRIDHGGHGREIFGLVVGRVVVVGIVEGNAGRGLWGPGFRNFDDEGFADRLATGEICVQCPTHFLLGSQDAVL